MYNNNLSYKTLKYYFNEKYVTKTKKLKYLKLDDISYYSITPYIYSKKIVNIISQYVDIKKSTIIDCCSCIGGDTINFCNNFKQVIAIEKDKLRFEYLKHNLDIFDIKNCISYNNDCMEILKTYKSDVIYFDLPWNGKNYKKNKKMKLYLNSTSLSELCLLYKNNTNILCLKVPNNYDFENMYTKLDTFFNIYNYNIGNNNKTKFKIIILKKIDT